MSTSSRGNQLEKRVMQELTNIGWLVVQSKASKGAADLMACKITDVGTHVLLVEVKTRPADFSVADRKAFHRLAVDHGAVPILVDAHNGASHTGGRLRLRWRYVECDGTLSPYSGWTA